MVAPWRRAGGVCVWGVGWGLGLNVTYAVAQMMNIFLIAGIAGLLAITKPAIPSALAPAKYTSPFDQGCFEIHSTVSVVSLYEFFHRLNTPVDLCVPYCYYYRIRTSA